MSEFNSCKIELDFTFSLVWNLIDRNAVTCSSVFRQPTKPPHARNLIYTELKKREHEGNWIIRQEPLIYLPRFAKGGVKIENSCEQKQWLHDEQGKGGVSLGELPPVCGNRARDCDLPETHRGCAIRKRCFLVWKNKPSYLAPFFRPVHDSGYYFFLWRPLCIKFCVSIVISIVNQLSRQRIFTKVPPFAKTTVTIQLLKNFPLASCTPSSHNTDLVFWSTRTIIGSSFFLTNSKISIFSLHQLGIHASPSTRMFYL